MSQVPDEQWRALAKQGKDLEAADLIASEIEGNQSSSPTTYFHAGQEYACAGQQYYKKAIRYLGKSYKQDDESWNNYVNATIAFLKTDEATLKMEVEKQSKPDLLVTTQKLKAGLEAGMSYKEAYDS